MEPQDNPKREIVIIITYVDGVILAVAVALRLLARWRSKAGFAADDWWIVGSLIPSYAMLISGAMMVKKAGAGRHTQTLTENELENFLKMIITTLVTYISTISAVRISLLLQYRRIFRTPNFERVCWMVGVMTVCWWISGVLVDIFQCHPVNAAWNPRFLFSPQCIDFQMFWYGLSGSNIVLDLFVLAMPLYMVWHLQMRKSQKIMLSGIFLIGCLSVLAGVLRIATIGQFKEIDIAYSFVTPYIWAQIEPSAAVLCACLMTYRPLFKGLNLSFIMSLARSSRRTSSKEQSSSGRDKNPSSAGTPWKTSGMFDHDLDRLNRKATSGDVHVIDIGTRSSTPFELGLNHDDDTYPTETIRKQSSSV